MSQAVHAQARRAADAAPAALRTPRTTIRKRLMLTYLGILATVAVGIFGLVQYTFSERETQWQQQSLQRLLQVVMAVGTHDNWARVATVLAAWNPSANMQLQVWDERTGALRFERLHIADGPAPALAPCAPANCLAQRKDGLHYRLSVHGVDADDARRDLLRRAFAVGLFMLWIATWVVLLVANRIAAPLKQLAEQAESLIGNASDQPISIPASGDEVAALATVLEASRQRLRAQVFRDVLTGLYNRRYLLDQLDSTFKRMRSANQQAALLVMDIDHFKLVNDRQGHEAGDQVLQDVAQRLQACRRESDLLVRFGGEEFVALLAVQSPEEAATQAARMLRQVADSPITLPNGTELSVTISIGMALGAALQDGALDADDLFRRLFVVADGALYQAKQGGRNRLVQAPQAVPQQLAPAPLTAAAMAAA